jgi:hypothetical protein
MTFITKTLTTISLFLFSFVIEVHAQNSLQNPLTNIRSFEDFVAVLLKAVITIGFPILILFIVYSGFLFVTAQGNEKKLETAKSTFYWTIVGAAIFLGSWTLALLIQNTVRLIAN